MAIERERKFLVHREQLPKLPVGSIIESGYFTNAEVAIRVTIRNRESDGSVCKVCFKGPGTIERKEFEYSIPKADAEELMLLAPTYMQKIRYDLDGWEVDHFFLGDREFWLAEWEEALGKKFPVNLPNWIGIEVTHIQELSNQRLAWKYGRKEGHGE